MNIPPASEVDIYNNFQNKKCLLLMFLGLVIIAFIVGLLIIPAVYFVNKISNLII